jgi:glyoxylase-like metal-dependent hydrolase (beta-lactamase superfamily II)
LPGASIIVDPNDYNASCPPGSNDHPSPGYRAPPDILAQLDELSVKPEDITHVIITHAHYDHYAGVTRETSKGRYEPTFPNATYYLGAEDWDSETVRDGLHNDPKVQNSLGVLEEKKLLKLVRGNHDVTNMINVIHAPGESPGHRIVKIHSGNDSMLYCIGDLFHHYVEVEEPGWGAEWTDVKNNMETRIAFSEAASDERALIAAGHMTLGKIERKDALNRFRWIEC